MDHLSGGSKLFISSAGKGYISCLAKDLNYIQEIMLDTCVRVEDFGQGWNYSEMGDRLELVFKFCSLLVAQDEMEVRRFICTGNGTAQEYEGFWGDARLLSGEILSSIKPHVLSIIDYHIDHSYESKKENFVRMREEHDKNYEDRLIIIENIEKELLKEH